MPFQWPKIFIKMVMLAGDLYFSLDVPANAAQLYQRAMKEDWMSKKILKISQAFSMAHDQEKALDWLEQGLENGRDSKLLRLKAQILYSQKKYNRAAHAYERLVETISASTPTPGKSHSTSLGNAWLMQGYAVLNQDQTDTERLARAQKAFLKAAAFKSQEKSALKALEHIKKLNTHPKQENSYVDISIKE